MINAHMTYGCPEYASVPPSRYVTLKNAYHYTCSARPTRVGLCDRVTEKKRCLGFSCRELSQLKKFQLKNTHNTRSMVWTHMTSTSREALDGGVFVVFLSLHTALSLFPKAQLLREIHLENEQPENSSNRDILEERSSWEYISGIIQLLLELRKCSALENSAATRVGLFVLAILNGKKVVLGSLIRCDYSSEFRILLYHSCLSMWCRTSGLCATCLPF